MATLTTKIKLRRGTAEDLAAIVLAEGEPAYATDTKKFSIGDGETAFSNLKNYGELDGKDAEEFAYKSEGVFFVVGNTSGTAGTWTGTNSRITAYFDGMIINYKIGIAGATTTTLNINGLGAKTCYLRGTTKITTHYEVGTMVLLSYNASTGAFYSADYDANSYAYVRQYKTTTNADYPMLFAYETTLPSSYDTKYTRKNSNITANPSTGVVKAVTFNENGTNLAAKYLGISAKATDSDKLDGNDSAYYLNYNNFSNVPDLSKYVTLATAQTITAKKTFTGGMAIKG